ncbi:hypothetical protein NXS19_014242 [Fusarium pseudograminearum]|nr:hypothetical protein NXS19_014242 [Fusarium pseudograminearum]
MPRPKVRAEDRRRAVKACVPCQNRETAFPIVSMTQKLLVPVARAAKHSVEQQTGRETWPRQTPAMNTIT